MNETEMFEEDLGLTFLSWLPGEQECKVSGAQKACGRLDWLMQFGWATNV